ncbi:MAG: YcxB family protein [Myxococcales bacterium]|nr:YcxB family protein [Myxococcales bacterium]
MGAWRYQHASQLKASVVAATTLAACLGFLLIPTQSALWAAGLALMAGGVLAIVLAWRLPTMRIRRASQDGTLTRPHMRVTADQEGLELTRDAWRSHVSWSAVERVVSRPRHVFVHISDVQAIPIPRRVLGDRAAQAGFVAQLRAWQERGSAPALPSDPDAGRDTWVLRFRLVSDDYVLFAQVVHAQHLGRTAAGWALLGALTAGVLLASAEPWRQTVDLGVVMLMLLFAGGITALGLAPAWVPTLLTPWLVRRQLQRSPGRMPRGQVVLGVGPEGGWMRTSQGVIRFGWSDVKRIHADADLVLLMFTKTVGVLIPSRAFEPTTDQDRWVEQVDRWRDVRPRISPSAPEGPPSVEVPSDPFAPPAS